MSESFSDRPSWAAKSCCEEAALNAAEVDRLTRECHGLYDELYRADNRLEDAEAERDELHGYIVECREMWARQLCRAECAETDLDRMREVLAVAKAERDEIQAKLDAAEQRPTLDRDAAQHAANNALPWIGGGNLRKVVDAIMALAPAVPEWLGDVPDKPEVNLGAQTATVGGYTYNVHNHTAKGLRAEAWRNLALADAMDAEEAQRSAEGESVEEQAKALANMVHNDPWKWDNIDERRRENYRAAIRAGWTKEADK